MTRELCLGAKLLPGSMDPVKGEAERFEGFPFDEVFEIV